MSEPVTITRRLQAQSLKHAINQRSLFAPWPQQMKAAVFGMGCFWGAERLFWQQPGVYVTMVGYCGGSLADPSYETVCSGTTNHAEVVRIIFDPTVISYQDLLTLFWENHQPTQGLRQGNDIGSQYRSCIFVQNSRQRSSAEQSRAVYQTALNAQGITARITTDIYDAAPFYYAEAYHQQYLAKHPDGYCGLGGSGVCMPK